MRSRGEELADPLMAGKTPSRSGVADLRISSLSQRKKQEGVEALKDEDPPEGSRLPIFPASLRGWEGWEGKISLVLPNTAEASPAPEAETTSRRSHALFPDRRRFESAPGNVLLVIAVKTGNSLMKECLKRTVRRGRHIF